MRVVADLRRRGGVEVGVERIWRGAGEAERRRRRGGGQAGGNGGG